MTFVLLPLPSNNVRHVWLASPSATHKKCLQQIRKVRDTKLIRKTELYVRSLPRLCPHWNSDLTCTRYILVCIHTYTLVYIYISIYLTSRIDGGVLVTRDVSGDVDLRRAIYEHDACG